ncbi:hypothetical protein AB2B38_013615 [Balneola sp. MJW-20]|uniref:hypothetical protein n=1 Tax=Gracilimonas aurantiaca TaxID=3234185 RepID=UPI0034669CB7
MKSTKSKLFGVFSVIVILFVQGCTVINLGVGTALAPPERDKQRSEFKLRKPKANGFTNTVTTKDSTLNTAVLTDFLIGTKEGELFPLRSAPLLVSGQDTIQTFLSAAGYSDNTSYFRTNSGSRITLSEIQSLQFDTTPFIKDSLLSIGDAVKDTTLNRGEIDEIYLGFGTTFGGMQPGYAPVIPIREVVSIHYKEPVMNTGTMYLVGVGLVTDLIIGSALLIRAIF